MARMNMKPINSGPSLSAIASAAASPLRATPIMAAAPMRKVDELKALKLEVTTKIAAMRQRHGKTLAEFAKEKRDADMELDRVCGDLNRAMAGGSN